MNHQHCPIAGTERTTAVAASGLPVRSVYNDLVRRPDGPYARSMSTTEKDMPADLRNTLRTMRRLAVAFHGSELRLVERTEHGAETACVAAATRRDAKVLVQA